MPAAKKYPKLKNQPLTLVLAEFRYSGASFEEGEIAQLKDRVTPDFGDFREQHLQQINIDASQKSVAVATAPILFWSDQDKGQFVQIEKERLVCLTTKYPRFEGFAAFCKEVLRHVEQVLSPKRLERVALRYNDLVVPDEGETLEQYIPVNMLAFDRSKDDVQMIHQHFTESVEQSEVGTLTVRSLTGKLGISIMPDLQTLQPFINAVPPPERLVTILDFDHQRMGSESFNTELAIEWLRSMHTWTRKAFWDITSDFARETKWA